MSTQSARFLLADVRRIATPRPAWGDPVVRPFTFKLIGGLEKARRDSTAVEIGVIHDAIALALAQLVRDRWAAEKRGHDEGRGRLRVTVLSSSQ